MKNVTDDFIKSLKKKAQGFSADEIVEEYAADGDGVLSLTKRKVTTKYYPPDTAALKEALERDGFSEMTDEQLEGERQRLLKELADLTNKREDSDEKN